MPLSSRSLLILTAACLVVIPADALAQASPRPPVLGSVTQGTPSTGPLELTLKDALERGLRTNLVVLLGQEGVEAARGARWRSLTGLLPTLSGGLSASKEQINLEAFGFTVPGQSPLIGPFNLFDARLYLSQPLLDFAAIERARASARNIEAAEHSYQDARDLVVQAVVTTYMQVVAARSRIDSVQSQLDTARALAGLASDLKASGLVPGIDVLRAQVQADAVQQRLIVARNDFGRAKLTLARIIGVPVEQELELADTIAFQPLEAISPEQAIATAYAGRADLKSATSRLEALRAEEQAARDDRLPSLVAHADYGATGQTTGSALPTFSVGAAVRVPLLNGGQTRGRELETAAAVRRQQATIDDLREQIAFEVRMGLLDVAAADERVRVAQGSVDLATQQLTQARDRFAAGVANSIEVVQAQEALATAEENLIASLFAHGSAKASLARSLGDAEHGIGRFIGVAP
jgi:outer membrane protein TolC